MCINDLKEKINSILQPKTEILFAYLFGSQSRSTAGRLSDVDIAAYLDKSQIPDSGPFGYVSELTVELQEALHKKIDLIILNDASIVMRFHIIKDGQLILLRSENERIRFHEKALREYLDFKPFLNVQKLYLRKRLAEGTFGGGLTGKR
jgi:predicted nucleotidyltransferase